MVMRMLRVSVRAGSRHHFGWLLVLSFAAVVGVQPTSGQTVSAETMFPIHRKAAQDYKIYATDRHDQAFRLNEQPLFVWTKTAKSGPAFITKPTRDSTTMIRPTSGSKMRCMR